MVFWPPGLERLDGWPGCCFDVAAARSAGKRAAGADWLCFVAFEMTSSKSKELVDAVQEQGGEYTGMLGTLSCSSVPISSSSVQDCRCGPLQSDALHHVLSLVVSSKSYSWT
jgi:hypothetical protein